MIDEYLKREEVTDLIDRIKNSPKYNTKIGVESTNYSGIIDDELSLYVLYDALLKYKIIVDDKTLFSDYIEQLDKLLKKINDYGNILVGVNNLICYMVLKYLKIDNFYRTENKEKIISFIYDKYIANGYYIHGFNSVYEKTIRENGFISEVYINKYNDMNKIKEIFKSKDYNIIEKDFTSNNTFFTDDYIMACYYSAMSPLYYSKIFFNEKLYGDIVKKNNYLKQDYDLCFDAFKKFLSKNFKDEEDYILNVFDSEWKYINSVPKRISLLLVKRSMITSDNGSKLEDYLNDKSNLFEIVDRMLISKNDKIPFNGEINSSLIEIVSLDNFYDKKSDVDEKEEDLILESKQKILKENQEFLDSYGKVYIFLIIGSLLVSLGVIISVIFALRGI